MLKRIRQWFTTIWSGPPELPEYPKWELVQFDFCRLVRKFGQLTVLGDLPRLEGELPD